MSEDGKKNDAPEQNASGATQNSTTLKNQAKVEDEKPPTSTSNLWKAPSGPPDTCARPSLLVGKRGSIFFPNGAVKHIPPSKSDGRYREFGDVDAPIQGTRSNETRNIFGISSDKPIPKFGATVSKMFSTPPPIKEVRISEAQAIDFGSSIVAIHVGKGDQQRTFAVHENVLYARSKYLKDELTQNGKKAVTLTDDDPKVFSLYVQLLYTGRIPSKAQTTMPKHDTEYEHLCKLYVLSHKFKDRPAQDIVLKAIHTKSKEVVFGSTNTGSMLFRDHSLPPREDIEIVYKGTSGPCGARRLIVDLYACKAFGHWIRCEEEPYPPEFMNELALSLLDHRKSEYSFAVKPVESYYDYNV